MIESKDKILMVAPHPDDEALGAGGMLLQYGQQTDAICMISSGVGKTLDEAREKSDIRIAEWNAAVTFCKANNLGCFAAWSTSGAMKDKITSLLPEYINTLDTKKYDWIFLPQPNDNHPEHRFITNKIMKKVLRKNGYKNNLKIAFYEVWQTIEQPNLYLPIDAEQKEKLLSLYKSQFIKHNFIPAILGLNNYRGFTNWYDGAKFAEAFSVISVQKYLRRFW